MSYAVLQKNSETPTLAQLKAAFHGVAGLTEYDAGLASRDTLGILAKGLSLENATALRDSLAAQGVPAEIVEDASLPKLPDPFFLARLDCEAKALMLHDSLGRVAELPWENISLIAAGLVSMSEFHDVRTTTKPSSGFGVVTRQGSGVARVETWLSGDTMRANFSGPQTRAEYETTEEHHNRLLLEIILTGGAVRYSINTAHALPQLFLGLGERRTKDLAQNFALLVQGLLQGAPHATTNRGIAQLQQNDFSYVYSGKTAFYNEIVWLLWQKSPGRLEA